MVTYSWGLLDSRGVERKVQIEIAGRTLSIRSDEGAEYIQDLASYVDGRIRELMKGNQTLSVERVALLIAIQLADELFREKDLNAQFRERIESRARSLAIALQDHEQRLQADK